MDSVNWISMLLATSTPIVIGYLFYHKMLFGKYLTNSVTNSIKSPNRFVSLICFIVFSFFLSFFLLNFNNSGINQEGDFDTFQHGAWHGMFLAIMVVSPVLIITGLHSQRPFKETLIHILYWIITLALMGGIMDAMNHWKNVIIP